MVPYFSITQFHLGPLTIQVWGLMVAIGILAGALLSGRFAQKNGLSKEVIYDGAFWIVLSAFFVSRVFHVVVYDLSFYLNNPAEILQFWHGGFSVIGGFLGALIAFLIFIQQKKLDLWRYADAFIFGLPLGLGCGRIGCFLIHDHPGTATHFFLGVKSPQGGAIHDHGLYLSLNGFLLAILFFILSKKKHSSGFFVMVFLLWYGVVRFVLDFYRIADTRYAGLTPAQFASILMFIAGLALWLRLRATEGKTVEPKSTA